MTRDKQSFVGAAGKHLWLAAGIWLAPSLAFAGDFPKFEYHEIDKIGNRMGQTSLVDVDKDGKLDWVAGCSHGDIWWFQYKAPGRWIRHKIGGKVGSEVGGIAMDVDGDGWLDQVSGSTWFRNPGRADGKEWTRYSNGAINNSHDVVAADIDGDGKLEVVMMQDTAGLFWYKIPSDPTKHWESHSIGSAVHAGIAPHGVGDIDGDGDLDIVRSTGWYENVDGRGILWKWHGNIDGGHGGRFKDATRVCVVDLDRDGHNDVVMTDCDTEIGPRRVHWFRNKDGKGGQWEHHIIATGKGDPHTLAVGDFNNDGHLDVFSGEGPMGGTGPGGKRRWFVWEDLDGRGTTWKEHVILEGPECHEGVAADVDGDGDLDICSKPWSGNLHVYLRNMLVEQHGQSPGSLSFVPEMEPVPEMNLPTAAARWSDAEKAKYADDLARAVAEWRKRVPEIKRQLPPERVRSLSRWAKTQMEQYKAIPDLEKMIVAPLGADPQNERLVLEGTIDTLPTHSPLVTRWLKVYLLYDLHTKSISRVTITIRGERLE